MSNSIDFEDVCCLWLAEVYAFVHCKNRINSRLSEKPWNQPLCLVAFTRFHNFHQVVFDIENVQAMSMNTWLTQVQRCKSYFQNINIAHTHHAHHITMHAHILDGMCYAHCALFPCIHTAHTLQQIGAFASFTAYEIMHVIHVPCRIQRFCLSLWCRNIKSTHIICPYKWY